MPIVADNLSFGYSGGTRGRLVLDSVSMALQAGVVTAIAGPNGAGKSTLLRLLLGLLRPTGGTVLLDGHRVASLSHRARAQRIAYVPQRTSLAFAFSVREYIRMGRFSAGAGGETSRDDAAIAFAMERADIADRADDPLPVLSAGQQQRATLARALAQLDIARAGRRGDGEGGGAAGGPGAPILLADEPVSAMDPRHALQTMGILRELARSGAAVAVVLHDLTLAARFCDSAVLLDQNGHPAATGPIAEALAPGTLSRVFGVKFLQVEGPDGAPILLATSRGAGGAGVCG